MNNIIVIDAKGKRLGRVATLAATKLMGKDTITFVANKIPDIQVCVTNAAQLELTQKKQRGKLYTRYSGYPGGLKQESMKHLLARRGHSEVLKRAVYGMLPKNKLRAQMMKRLVIEE